MAHFKRGNLQLKTNQQIQLGDSQESLLKYDGTDLLLNPSSGAVQLFNDGDLKLSTDSTGVIVTGDLNVSGDLNLDGTIVDLDQYSLVSGERDFTGTVGGLYPVSPTDLTTKSYVDEVAYVDSTQVVVVHDHADLDTGGFVLPRDQYAVDFEVDRDPPPWKEGRIFWDKNNHSFAVYNDESEITLQVGQEVFIRVRNESGVLIPNGAVVALVGAFGGLPAVVLADASDPTLMVATAIATHSIENNSNGYVTYVGAVNDVDTTEFNSGDLLYVSATIPGGITNVRPNSPNVGHRIGVATIDSTAGQIVVASHPADDPMEVMNYTLPLSGVTANVVELTGTFREVAAGVTGDIATDWSVNNNHFYMYVNSLTGSGDVTITGVSINESTGVPIGADTEVIVVDASGTYYQSNKKWWEITNIQAIGDISAIDYDYGVIGYPDLGNRNFRLIGYRCEALASGINADFTIIIQKFQDDGDKKMTIIDLESIGVDSNAAGDIIIDNLRVGGDDRSLDPASTVFDNGEQIVFKQLDFSDYFTSNENIVLGRSGNEGFYIRIEGAPLGTGIASVSFVNIYIYYELLSV